MCRRLSNSFPPGQSAHQFDVSSGGNGKTKIIFDIMFKGTQNNRGFTIIEVIVALVIVGVSITMFVRLLGNSAMLRGKINAYDERLEIAVTKAEQSFLGLIEAGFDLDNNKNIIQGKVEGRDINWRIEDESIDGFSGFERDVYLYTVSVEGVYISSVGLR